MSKLEGQPMLDGSEINSRSRDRDAVDFYGDAGYIGKKMLRKELPSKRKELGS